MVAFAALIAATVAAFFVTQHLKVTTPLIAGSPAPDPAVINPLAGGTCGGVDHRFTRISFYLLHRSDDVDVYVIDQGGSVVRTLASDRHMRRRVRNPDGDFAWNGREDSGRVAPGGTYFIEVALIHQGRTVIISNPAGPEPITVRTTPPHPVVQSVLPQLIPQPSGTGVSARGSGVSARGTEVNIRYSGNEQHGALVRLYRTDLPGTPALVKTFGAGTGALATWDGNIRQRPAPAGTYLVGIVVTDGACVKGQFPSAMPPPPGSTAHAGITVRYLAAEPPSEPVPAGSRALVYVDSRRSPYRWALRRAGAPKVISLGGGSQFGLQVPLPAGGAGLYELSVRSGPYRTVVPVVASRAGAGAGGPAGFPGAAGSRAAGSRAAAGAGAPPVLVVLPALTWQGLNPVDEDGDGIPNTLEDGGPISLERPYANGLPGDVPGEGALLSYLDSARLPYDLTTDLGLIEGTGPSLAGHAAVVLAGPERWLPPSLGSALRAYVQRGGHLLSLGIDSLRRGVTIRRGKALDPTPPSASDALGARPGALVTRNADLITVIRDGLGIFQGTAGAFAGFTSYQPFAGVQAPGDLVSEAGTGTSSASIIGYKLGEGFVVDVGLPGFGSMLGHDGDAQGLMKRLWMVLSG